MLGKNTMDYIAIIIAIGAALGINRSAVKKQVIADLQSLVTTLQAQRVEDRAQIDDLKAELIEKDKQICHLQETIDGYAELVREGYLAGGNGARRGNSSTHSKTTKNGSTR